MNISSRMLTRPGQSPADVSSKVSARIRQEIAHTHEKFAGSAAALANKLGESARVKETAIGRIAQPVKTTVRQRPVPAAAVVLGVLVVLRLLFRRPRN